MMEYENNNQNETATGTTLGGRYSGQVSGQNYSYMGTGTEATNNNYPNYIPQSSTPTGSEKKEEKKKRESKGYLKKTLAILALGIFFGISSGVAFYVVNTITGGVDKKAATVEQAPKAEKDETKKEIKENTNNEIENAKLPVAESVVTDVTEVVKAVMPSVVSITNTYTATESFFGQNFSSESEASGSGIIVNENDKELLIVTNNHVVAEADSLKVQFIDGEVVDAQIKGTDFSMDLAVISVKMDDLKDSTKESICLATLGDSDSLQVGEPAIAIGNALGYGQSVTTGVISALDRQIEMYEDGSTTGKLIQTDAAINPGNSGGALLNVRGEVIGINSNKIGGSTIEGMGYAIPISSAQPIIENLMSRETKDKVEEGKKGFLGISGINVTRDVSQMYSMPQGVFIAQVYDNTAAKEAGLQKGDIITKFEGSTVGSMEDLQGYLEYYEAGESVTLTIQRAERASYDEMEVTVVLSAQTAMPEQDN